MYVYLFVISGNHPKLNKSNLLRKGCKNIKYVLTDGQIDQPDKDSTSLRIYRFK